MKNENLSFLVCLTYMLVCGAGCDDNKQSESDIVDTESDFETNTDLDTSTEPSSNSLQICEDFEMSPQRIHDDVAYLASDEMAGRPPASSGNKLAMEYVEELFMELEFEPVGDSGSYYQEFSFDQNGSNIDTSNLLAVVPGIDENLSKEVIIVSAHIDHIGTQGEDIFNGADDNASGVAVLMEVARTLACSPQKPSRTVLFAIWNAEETGLHGSRYYVDYPVYPLNNTLTVLNFDMVGGGNGTGVMVYDEANLSNEWVADLMQASAADQEVDFDVQTEFFMAASSDQISFHEAGVSAVLLLTLPGLMGHPNFHTPQDTIDNIVIDDLEAASVLGWAVFEPLANGTETSFLEE